MSSLLICVLCYDIKCYIMYYCLILCIDCDISLYNYHKLSIQQFFIKKNNYQFFKFNKNYNYKIYIFSIYMPI